MISAFHTFALVTVAAISDGTAFQAKAQTTHAEPLSDHLAWVGQALKRMQTIKPGLTRETLLTVFTTQGGVSTPRQRTYVSRDCPFFKVDVEFEAVRQPRCDADGRMTGAEDGRDVIVKISCPYLQFLTVD